MRILLRTCSSEPEFNADCDCVVVDIDKQLMEAIAQREVAAKLLAMMPGCEYLYELYFFDALIDCYDYSVLERVEEDAAMSDSLERSGFAVLGADFSLPSPDDVTFDDPERSPYKRTECTQLVIRRDLGGRDETEVSWFFYPKHCDTQLTTPGVIIAKLREAFEQYTVQ